MDILEMNRIAIEEFRTNGGKCSGWLEGAPVVLLTMTGAKSGRELTSPLVYSTDGDDVIVIASKGGAPSHPNWYHNLKANPEVTVEIGTDTWTANAVEAEGDDRTRLYDAQAAMMPQFKDYESSAADAGRVIPVFRLVRRSTRGSAES